MVDANGDEEAAIMSLRDFGLPCAVLGAGAFIVGSAFSFGCPPP